MTNASTCVFKLPSFVYRSLYRSESCGGALRKKLLLCRGWSRSAVWPGTTWLRDGQRCGNEDAALECAAPGDVFADLYIGEGDGFARRRRVRRCTATAHPRASRHAATTAALAERGVFVDGDHLLHVVGTHDGDLQFVDFCDAASDEGLAEILAHLLCARLHLRSLLWRHDGDHGGVDLVLAGLLHTHGHDVIADLDVGGLYGLPVFHQTRIRREIDGVGFAGFVLQTKNGVADGGDGASDAIAATEAHASTTSLPLPATLGGVACRRVLRMYRQTHRTYENQTDQSTHCKNPHATTVCQYRRICFGKDALLDENPKRRLTDTLAFTSSRETSGEIAHVHDAPCTDARLSPLRSR